MLTASNQFRFLMQELVFAMKDWSTLILVVVMNSTNNSN